jgi:hypothetical protein
VRRRPRDGRHGSAQEDARCAADRGSGADVAGQQFHGSLCARTARSDAAGDNRALRGVIEQMLTLEPVSRDKAKEKEKEKEEEKEKEDARIREAARKFDQLIMAGRDNID